VRRRLERRDFRQTYIHRAQISAAQQTNCPAENPDKTRSNANATLMTQVSSGVTAKVTLINH
jgi:hypothetical protein